MEHITCFTLEHPELALSVERELFYDERQTTYADHYLYVVDVLLFNSHGEVLLQKRSRRKKKNPGAFHTTVGGHVNFGEDPAFTLVHETFEEIGAGCYVIPVGQDFGKPLEKLSSYTDQIVLIEVQKDYFRTHIGYVASAHSDVWIKDRVYFCFGLYDGGFKSVDRSSDGCEWFSLHDLGVFRKKYPELFTSVLHSYLDEFATEMQEFANRIKTK